MFKHNTRATHPVFICIKGYQLKYLNNLVIVHTSKNKKEMKNKGNIKHILQRLKTILPSC